MSSECNPSLSFYYLWLYMHLRFLCLLISRMPLTGNIEDMSKCLVTFYLSVWLNATTTRQYMWKGNWLNIGNLCRLPCDPVFLKVRLSRPVQPCRGWLQCRYGKDTYNFFLQGALGFAGHLLCQRLITSCNNLSAGAGGFTGQHHDFGQLLRPTRAIGETHLSVSIHMQTSIFLAVCH